MAAPAGEGCASVRNNRFANIHFLLTIKFHHYEKDHLFYTWSNMILLTILLSVKPKEANASLIKDWDAKWMPCEGLTPPHYANLCEKGSTYVSCNNGPCGILIPGIEIIK